MQYADGPYAIRDPFRIAPPVVTPGTFLGLAAELTDALHGITAGHDQTYNELTADGGIGLAVPDDGAIGASTNAARDIAPGSGNEPLAIVDANGQAVDEDHQVQQGHVPGPDEPEPGTEIDGPIEPEPAAPPEPPPGKGGPGEGGPGGGPPGEPTEDERYQAQVREAIRRMYRELLGREADPGGLANWMDWIIVRGQSLEWVREQIMQSDEYRDKHGG